MRFQRAILIVALAIFALSSVPAKAETEDEIVNRYLKKIEKKHVRKLGWISANFSSNRINRHNDYNDFATIETNNFNSGSVGWLEQANSFGLEFGSIFKERFAWSIGGEYWMQLGQNEEGDYSYTPSGGLQTSVTNLQSEIAVFGVSTGLQYYFKGNPTISEGITQLSLRGGLTAGFYQVSWDVWDAYPNYNLTTSNTATSNNTFKGNAPGLSAGLGMDYPLNFYGLSFGADMSYFYLNFTNVAWYNSIDQEIVASVDGTEEGRIDLNFSGVRGKLEIKRFFNW